MNSALLSLALLTVANVFMTFAWYGHLKNLKDSPLWMAILVSWGIALIEYCFQVPANRMGAEHYTLAQLKIMQEVITLTVFIGFSYLYFNEPVRMNYIYAGACMAGAVFFVFKA